MTLSGFKLPIVLVFWGVKGRIRVPRVTRVFEKKDSSNRVFQNRVIWNHYLILIFRSLSKRSPSIRTRDNRTRGFTRNPVCPLRILSPSFFSVWRNFRSPRWTKLELANQDRLSAVLRPHHDPPHHRHHRLPVSQKVRLGKVR